MKRAERVNYWKVPGPAFQAAKQMVNDAPDNQKGLRSLDPVNRDLWRKCFSTTHQYSTGRGALAALDIFPPEKKFSLDENRERWLKLAHEAFPLHGSAEFFQCAHPYHLAHCIRTLDDHIEQWPDTWGDVTSIPYLIPLIEQEGEKAVMSTIGNRIWKMGYQICQNDDQVGGQWIGDRYMLIQC